MLLHRFNLMVMIAVLAISSCAENGVKPLTTTSLSADSSVGVVGCSVTLDAVRGYHRLNGARLWTVEDLNYGLGTVSAWAQDEGQFWSQFLEMFATRPDTDAIWWQLCAGNGEDTLENAMKTLERLMDLAPSVTIYVSSQPLYPKGHLCPIAGPNGPLEMREIADALASSQNAERGPDMGTFDADNLRDNCHVDMDGRQEQGQILKSFFDR